MVAHEVGPRRRDQRGETAEQLARLEDEDLAAVAEAPLHAVRELAVGKRGKPLLRERWTGAIAAQLSQALPVVRVQMNTGVQRETLVVRGEALGFPRVWRLAAQGRHRLCLRRGERIRRPCILSQGVEPGFQECADAALQAAQDLSHVVIGKGGKRHEPDHASFAGPDTVEDHAMLCGARDYAEWLPRKPAARRFLALRAPHNHGWYVGLASRRSARPRLTDVAAAWCSS